MAILADCPLCGNADMDNDEGVFFNGNKDTPYFAVRCGNPSCGCEVVGDTKGDAIARWNRRTNTDTQRIDMLSNGVVNGIGFCLTSGKQGQWALVAGRYKPPSQPQEDVETHMLFISKQDWYADVREALDGALKFMTEGQKAN